MKIAILYICTGIYNQFWEGFYNSSEQLFLNGVEKHYFVFTDDMKLSDAENVHLNYKKFEGFPKDSLFRFEMFIRVKEQLKKFDYVFFFNANMLFVAPVGEELLPKDHEVMAVVHPGFYNKPAILYPYERNKQSTAYIPRGRDGYKYYMGSLNGGTAEGFLRLVEDCAQKTRDDWERGIVAVVHDESHLNRYMSENGCDALSPAYAYPEGWKLPFEPKIMIRDKEKINPYFTKGRDHSLKGKVKKGFWILGNILRWYLK